MAEAPRLAAALRYQQGLDDPTRPATVNPMMARQVAKSRELMTAPTSIMDERYPAWKKAQEDADLFLLGADAAGLAPFAAKGATVAAKFAAPKLAQGLEQHMIRSGMILPIDVYHGSPHRFAPTAKNPLGEFDPTKIGTGEGAQAYGYGHYLAENPGIGKGYAMALGPKTAQTDPQYLALKERLGKFEEKLAKRYNMGEEVISPREEVIFTPDKYPKRVVNAAHKLSDAEDAAYKAAAKGTLYKVNLSDEAIPRMLDWDKPLSQQHPDVQAALAKIDKDTYHPQGGDYSPEEQGQMIYMRLANSPLAKNQVEAAELLKRSGIPGIQYLDAGSRGAGTGTRNFVVFPGNENLLNILGRE